MNRLKVTVFMMAAFFTAAASAAPQVLPEGSLACSSEEAFEKQFSYLSQGVNKTVSGCGVTNQDLEVVIIDFNITDATEVSVVSNGATLYVVGSDLE